MVKQSFPNITREVSASAGEINYLVGLTSRAEERNRRSASDGYASLDSNRKVPLDLMNAQVARRDTAATISAAWTFTNASYANLFPSGTRMLFQQTSAPTGWTKDTTANLNDTALRIVTGTVGSRTSQSDFSTVFGKAATDGHTLTIAEMPSHDHPGEGASFMMTGPSPGDINVFGGGGFTTSQATTGDRGGGGSHSHDMDIRVNYHDVIIASKD